MSSERGSSVHAWHLMAHDREWLHLHTRQQHAVVMKTDTVSSRNRQGCTFARPSSKITRMSSPGFQWPVRGLVRAALLDDSGQTDACCALLVTPTRGPERLEG